MSIYSFVDRIVTASARAFKMGRPAPYGALAHAAIQMLYALRRRLELFVNLPLHGADRAAIRSDVRDLAHMR